MLVLIVIVLSVSLFSFVYLGTSLILRDKTSYIYDYQASELKSVADAIEAEISASLKLAAALTPLAAESDLISKAPSGFSGLLLKPSEQGRKFEVASYWGKDSDALRLALQKTAWTPTLFEKSEYLVGTPVQGKIAIGGMSKDRRGQAVGFVTSISIKPDLLSSLGGQVQRYLLDSSGNVLQSGGPTGGAFNSSTISSLQKAILEKKADQGAMDWSDHENGNGNGNDSIVSYNKFARGTLIAISIVSKDFAFAAARSLVMRSLVLGCAIFLITAGLSLILIRRLTSPLRQMWFATQRVTEGDFSCRVNAKSVGHDEVSDLATSFNLMSSKITELMEATAEKARMEKELETAQTYQSRFFPEKPYEDSLLQINGAYVPASECAGDWWHYAKIGDKLLIVMGDVTGHGVSAALFTALVTGAFSLWIGPYRSGEQTDLSLLALLKKLNSVIRNSTGGDANMTFLAMTIHLKTGECRIANASQTFPYLYRKGSASAAPKKITELFKPLTGGCGPAPLGWEEDYVLEEAVYQLEPGDAIIFYTDGVFEPRNQDQTKIKKTAFLELLSKNLDRNPSDLKGACEGVVQDVLEFFGGKKSMNPDDVTLVMTRVSPEARWNP
jgi:serine phosphatase RsbU (regulator of sigma subunit)